MDVSGYYKNTVHVCQKYELEIIMAVPLKKKLNNNFLSINKVLLLF